MSSDTPKAPQPPPGGVTRRDVLGGTTALGVAGALIATANAGASGATPPTDAQAAPDAQFAREIRDSCTFVVAGETLDENRMKAMRGLFETNLKEIELLRQFDPDEEEPVTQFRPW